MAVARDGLDWYWDWYWHVNQVTETRFRGQYSGEIVRNESVAFIRARSRRHAVGAAAAAAAGDRRPFFLYVAFQEAHAPFQVYYIYIATMYYI